MPHTDENTFGHERRANARRMLAALERVIDAVDQFNAGEINLDEAMRRIADVVAARRAA